MASPRMGALPDPVTIRPRSGMVLTGVIAALAVAGVIALLVQGDVRSVVRYGLFAVVVVYATWLLFWYPNLQVDPGGITVRNVARTFRVQWPALVSVETRYALTLHTAKDRVTAWSAPAPSRYAAGRNTSVDVRNLQPRGDRAASVPIGDIPESGSGLAAWHIRATWSALREAGYLKSGTIDGSGVTHTWNARALLVGAGIFVVAVVVAIAL